MWCTSTIIRVRGVRIPDAGPLCVSTVLQPARIMAVTSSGMPFLPLLRSYSAFTFRRMTEVQGGPKQVCGAFPVYVYLAPRALRKSVAPCLFIFVEVLHLSFREIII